MEIVIIWGGLGLIGVVIYLVRTSYLWPFIREHILNPVRQGAGGSDMGSIIFSMFLTPILILVSLVFRNLILLALAIILGPIAIVVAIRIKPEDAIRTVPVDLDFDWRMEMRDVYTHYYAGEYVYQCYECKSLEPVEACDLCGGVAYGPGSSMISCRKCGARIGTWTCPQCSHRNPVKGSLAAVRPRLVGGGM